MESVMEQMDADDLKRMQKRREWVVVGRVNYLDGIIETREGRPLMPRIKMRIDYRAAPAKGSAAAFSTMADARQWIDAHQTGGNPTGLLHEIAERRWAR